MEKQVAIGWRFRRGLCVLALGLAAGCGDTPQGETSEPAPPATAVAESPAGTLSPSAQVATVEELKLDLEAPRHPSDGGGRAFIAGAAWFRETGGEPVEVELPGSLPAGGYARIDLVYEAGPLGVAVGGMVLLQVSPFWGWDTPQTEATYAPGYSEVATDAAGVELTASTLAETLLGIEIGGRALAAGETIRVRYGAGALGARVDRFAEREARIWFAVDGDGDGVRALVPDSPSIDLHAGPPEFLHISAPTTAHPGDRIAVQLALLDGMGNSDVRFAGDVALSASPGLELPARVSFEEGQAGRREIEVLVTQEGVHHIRALAPTELGPLEATSNPIVARAAIPRVLWGDLHGHSNFSDGTGTPEDYMSYAREVAGLDVVALTDHDHWGMQFLDATPPLWDRIRAATQAAHEPGRFVTLLGFEWTSWLQGHRHVLYFSDEGEIISSLDPQTETPDQLWQALAGKPALTFAHHSAGGPVATNWLYAPDPVLEPVTEIVSVHGSSEAMDSPKRIYAPVPGNFVRDALDHGYELGFIGSGDGHNGHPGLASLTTGADSGGLAAILSEDRTREGVLAALRARRVYATSGERIWLQVSLDGAPMGSRVEVAGSEQALAIEVIGSAALERVDLIRGGSSGEAAGVESIAVDDASEWRIERNIPALAAGEYLYVRVVQQDGGMAWSSPIRAH